MKKIVSFFIAFAMLFYGAAAQAAIDIASVSTEMDAGKTTIEEGIGYMIVVVVALWAGRKLLGLFGR